MSGPTGATGATGPTGSGFNREQLSALDYFAKRAAASKVKTDSTSTVITISNELNYTSTTVTGDNVWLDEKTLYKGAAISVSEGVATATSYVKMQSIHGVGGVSPDNPNLIGVAWKAPITNWIDAKFDSDFEPVFFMGPNSLTDYVPSMAFKQLGSSPLCPYIFDYKTGILTFIDTVTKLPINLKEKVVDPTTGIVTSKYAIWISGYTYTGRTLDQVTTTPEGTNWADYLYWDSNTKKWEVGDTNINLGADAGQYSQQTDSIAIGHGAGKYNQGESSIAIGHLAGYTGQGGGCLAFGNSAGELNQSNHCIAIGSQAGKTGQGEYALAIGHVAGYSNQADHTIIINATGDIVNGTPGQSRSFYVAPIREDNTTTTLVGLGYNPETYEIVQSSNLGGGGDGGGLINGTNWGDYLYWNSNISRWEVGDTNITLGAHAGETGQQYDAIAIGDQAGQYNQQSGCLAIGRLAGFTGQMDNAVAVGAFAGSSNQHENSIAIGLEAGRYDQGTNISETITLPKITYNVAGTTSYNLNILDAIPNSVSIAIHVTGSGGGSMPSPWVYSTINGPTAGFGGGSGGDTTNTFNFVGTETLTIVVGSGGSGFDGSQVTTTGVTYTANSGGASYVQTNGSNIITASGGGGASVLVPVGNTTVINTGGSGGSPNGNSATGVIGAVSAIGKEGSGGDGNNNFSNYSSYYGGNGRDGVVTMTITYSKIKSGGNSIAIGNNAGSSYQNSNAIAIGTNAGTFGGPPVSHTHSVNFTTAGIHTFDVDGYIASIGGLPNKNIVNVTVVGGGGGGNANPGSGQMGGGSGGYTTATYSNLSTITASVGAAGTNTPNPVTATSGGPTTFTSGSYTLTATGGRGAASGGPAFSPFLLAGAGGSPNGKAGTNLAGGAGYGNPVTNYGGGGMPQYGTTNATIPLDGAVLITITYYLSSPDGAGSITNIPFGAGNIAIGYCAALYNQSYNAIAIGNQAATHCQGDQSVAIGQNAGQTNQRTNAIAIGYNAGQTGQAENSIAIGQGAQNTALENDKDQGGGIAIGGNSKSYYDSVAIGQHAQATTNGAGGSIALGANAFATYPQSIVLNGSGGGVTSSAAGFFVSPVRNLTQPNGPSIPLTYGSNIANEIAQSNWICVNKIDSTGGGLRVTTESGGLLSMIGYNGGAFADQPFLGLYNIGSPFYGPSSPPDLFYVSADTGNVLNKNGSYGQLASDSTLKENIVSAREYLDDVCKLQVKKYNFIDDPDKTPLLGFIAQEVEPIFPGLVPKDKTTGKYQLKTSILIPMLVSCVQTLNNRVTTLESELADIKKTLASMKT
jgi:hypothetical protein